MRFIRASSAGAKWYIMFLGVLMIVMSIYLLFITTSYTEKNDISYFEHLPETYPLTEFDTFKIENAVISPVILNGKGYTNEYGSFTKNTCIGLLSKDRWENAKKALHINGTEKDALSKLLSSDFKPLIYYIVEDADDNTKDKYISKISRSINVEGGVTPIEDVPDIDSILQKGYSNAEPLLIKYGNNSQNDLFTGISFLLLGILFFIYPFLNFNKLFKKYFSTDEN